MVVAIVLICEIFSGILNLGWLLAPEGKGRSHIWFRVDLRRGSTWHQDRGILTWSILPVRGLLFGIRCQSMDGPQRMAYATIK